jgi:hypothetical protein
MKRAAFGRNLTSLPGLLPMYKRPVTYLDTNAVSDLSRWEERAPHIDGIEQVRRDLCSFASKRTIALSQWLFSEMAGFENGRRREKFEADMTFVNDLQHLKVLRAAGEMMQHEVECFLTRRQVDPYINLARPISFNDPQLRAMWVDEREFVKDGKSILVQEEGEAKVRIDAAYPNVEKRVQRLTDDWRGDRRGILSEWVRGKMRRDRTFLGLPPDTTTWPEPEQVPTLWCHWAYRITRDILIEILPEPPGRKPSDFVDLGHYQSGAHVDEFVTRDADLLLFAKEAPGPKPEFLTLEEWVARLLH